MDLRYQKSLQFSDTSNVIVSRDLLAKSVSHSQIEIITGALGAIILLQATYKLNPELLARGVLQSSSGQIEVEMNGMEHLQVDDLLYMANLARWGAFEFCRYHR